MTSDFHMLAIDIVQACMHACKQVHMLKQFCKRGVKVFLPKAFEENNKFEQKRQKTHTQTHKELKPDWLHANKWKRIAKWFAFFIARVHLQRLLLICTYAFPLQWICDCAGFLIIALTVRISNPSTWASQCTPPMRSLSQGKTLKWHVCEQRIWKVMR